MLYSLVALRSCNVVFPYQLQIRKQISGKEKKIPILDRGSQAIRLEPGLPNLGSNPASSLLLCALGNLFILRDLHLIIYKVRVTPILFGLAQRIT